MGLPMYVSPSLSKRQLPPKQPQSPSNNSDSSNDANQNSRTSAFEIPELQSRNDLQRHEERRRRRSLPYNHLQQHIQRLHQLHLHRTREQMISSSPPSPSSLTARRVFQANLVNLQAGQSGTVPIPPLRSPVRLRTNDEHRSHHRHRSHHSRPQSDGDSTSSSSSSSSHSTSSNTIPTPSTAALDEVVRRVNLLRQITQNQERLLRPRYRSSSGSNRSLSSSGPGLTREELLLRMHFPPLSVDNSTLSAQNLGRLLPLTSSQSNINHRHHHRHYAVALEPTTNSGSFDSFEAESPVTFGLVSDDPIQNQQTRILSPIPRRYNNPYSATLAIMSGNSIELDDEERDGYEIDGNGISGGIREQSASPYISANDDEGIEIIRQQRGSASGECC